MYQVKACKKAFCYTHTCCGKGSVSQGEGLSRLCGQIERLSKLCGQEEMLSRLCGQEERLSRLCGQG